MSKMAFQSPTIIINMAAGSTSDVVDELTSIFEKSGYSAPKTHLCEAGELTAAFKDVETSGTDLLGIMGGDGTCLAGAVTARKLDVPLIPLPGGTMNMLPKAVYGDVDWREALAIALSQKKSRWQSAGLLNNKLFFCGAILGDPITMAEARESLRDGAVIEAVKQLPGIMSAISDGEEFEVRVDGATFERAANGLQIYCPYMTAGATSKDAFEVASVPHLSVSNLFEIGGRAIAQDWRDSSHIKTALASKIDIKGQGAFDILLDGEHDTTLCPISINIDPKGVRVLAPDHGCLER